MLDLYGTELVVLSACETGLGESSDTEGIYGLQRAFKQAGANKLIVSLWQVPDQQTQELMGYFYKNYLSGKSIHESLETAKTAMRKRYSNPYYWAAFILVE
jgi:CHAT domain-containing protein